MKQFRYRLAAASLLAASVTVVGVAVPICAAGAGEEPGLVQALRARGADILSLGAQGGLEGYFVTPGAVAGYGLYVTADGHAVAGLLYAPDGTEITRAQLAAARGGEAGGGAVPAGATGPAPGAGAAVTAHAGTEDTGAPSPSRAALFERSAAAFGFTLGESGPLVLLFGDAACRWSRAAAARLGREAIAGRLRLRVVPVAVLGAGAAQEAASIAASAEPARAWFVGTTRTADRRGAERIARNNALLDAWGANAVPLIAWRAADGAVAHRIGDIEDVGAWLRETLGPDTLRVGDPRAGHPQGGRGP